MARRQQLSENQLAELFDAPVEQRELVRHYTMSSENLARPSAAAAIITGSVMR